MDNNEILSAVADWASARGLVQKGVIGTDNVNFGGIMPREAVQELLDLTKDQSEWIGSLDSHVQDGVAGTVPIVDLNQNITEGVGENDGTKIGGIPNTRNVPYVCKKFKSDWYITTDQIREARVAGVGDFDRKMSEIFAKQLSNDIAEITINSDSSLDNTTSRNRMLRMLDGLRVKTESANVTDAEGKAFATGIFTAMEDAMPDKYASDPDLQWLFNRRVHTHYKSGLQQLATGLGDKAKTQVIYEPPNGISPIIVPQLSSGMGPVAVAPTSATDNTGTITFDLTTMVTAGYVATAAAGAGRKVIVTCVPTGVSEYCYAVEDTQLKITTAGTLGQTTVSTTASDYLVTFADETELYLGNLKAITLVQCGQMRSYMEFNKDFDRFETTVYHYMDVLIPNPAAIVKFKRVAVTPIRTW